MVLCNPRLGVCLCLEAKKRLAGTIVPYNRYMERLISFRYNGVFGHSGVDILLKSSKRGPNDRRACI
jgi:hypothetical protein